MTNDSATVINNGTTSPNSSSFSLGGTKDNNEISISISYTDTSDLQENSDKPLEISLDKFQDQLTINGNQISGFLSIFNNKRIKYVSNESTLTKTIIKETTSIKDLDLNDVKELISFHNDPRSLDSFNVTCTQGTDSVTMSFFIENDYDTGKYFVESLVKRTIDNKKNTT
jgi:hypothetical protein